MHILNKHMHAEVWRQGGGWCVHGYFTTSSACLANCVINCLIRIITRRHQLAMTVHAAICFQFHSNMLDAVEEKLK